jgi:hypothetical protein
MKIFLYLTFLFALNASADESVCKPIQNIDERNYCYATETNQKEFCYTISDKDLKNLCMAQQKNQKFFCYKIFSTETQKKCLKSLK